MNNELHFPPNFERLVLGCFDASKQASSFGPSQKRKETQVSARNSNAHDLILPVPSVQYYKTKYRDR